MRDGGVFFRTEDQTHRWLLMWMRPMLTRVVEIQVHLAGIRMREFSQFQVHHDEALQFAVEENQIDPIPFCSDAQALLARNEGEIVAQLKQELLEAQDQRVFDVRLRVLIFQIQEFKNEWISQLLVGCQDLVDCGRRSCTPGPPVGEARYRADQVGGPTNRLAKPRARSTLWLPGRGP